ncbi:MAG TPA: Ig-like domain-containing protein, partial [Candidatus Pacearchaeota archaeon]|nr:Ig-like domain-containing protein [Candidatus Pacearchaeota archaeon]
NHRPEVATGTEQVSNLAFPIADSVQIKIKQKTQELVETNKEALEKAKEQKESIEFVSPKEKVVEVDRGIDQTINAINKQKESIDSVVIDNQGKKEIINEINEKNEEITDILAKQQKNIISVKDNGNVSNIEKVEEINNEIMNIISDQGSVIKSIIGFEKEHEVINQITSLAMELNQEDLSGEDIIEKYVDLYDNYEQVVSDFYESPEMQESLVQAREIVQETIREMSVSREEVELIEEIKNPKEEGPVLKDIFSVNDLVVQEKIYREDGSEDIAKLAISGFGPINSLIFLFLYSDPIMVYTETDSNGMWNYILEAELEDGNHEIYVASVDRAGNIIARSNAIPFVKEAAAVQLDFMPISLVGAQSVDFFDRKNITAISLIFLFILIVTIILTGISVSKKQYFQE